MVGLYLLESSFFPFFAWKGISPDLLLLFVISISFLKGPRVGVSAGLLSGLLGDLATGTFLGIATLSKIVVAYICGEISRSVYRDSFLLTLVAVALTTVGTFFLTYVLLFFLGYATWSLSYVGASLFPMLTWNILCAYPVHRLIYYVEEMTKKTAA